ncbi:adenylate/guanylate cyclase domain-containing protein [Phyllobacterium sp. 21LDTY02-6]|uniref:adenylate/guanylate cyclase domain-containing protein n=1 Tax=Phyllobacterium sp. 21LDTY02-6 TaxID=2944903 RepID=UPI003531C50A
MTDSKTRPLFSERSLRRMRLITGLIMLVFVALHLSNHALNLVSLKAAEHGRDWFLLIWRNPLGTLLLYGAALVHVVLVMRAIYARRTLVMPPREAVQIVLGLLIPLLLIEHVVGTRLRHEIAGLNDNYEFVIRSLWIESPANGVKQAITLVIVWIHGCIGVHFWLRYRQWYAAAAPFLLTIAILAPVLALLGFADAGRVLASEPVQSSFGSGYGAAKHRLAQDLAAQQTVDHVRYALYGGFGSMLIGVVALRSYRRWRERADQIAIRYPEGQTVRVPRGFSVLEASRLGGIPHYAVCGGKGRCSTCRVLVIEGAEDLPAPDATERNTLRRINADADVRLACQLRPQSDISIVPLLAPALEANLPPGTQEANPGREQEIVVLFCDIRNFTALTEAQLPFDIVFLLNRYFAIVGHAVEQSGGRVDKFIGDGAMALFGLRGTMDAACRSALRASALIARQIEQLSKELAPDLGVPLRVAIGIHTGTAIVGTMGHGNVKNLTAIGDTVNVASRLEAVAKELDVTLVVSEPTVRLAASDMTDLESREINVRGRAEPLRAYVVPQETVGRFA